MARRTDIPASVQAPRIILLLSVFALLLIGLVMVYSASSVTAISSGKTPYMDVLMQAAYAAIGIICALVLWKVVPYRFWTEQGFIWIYAVSFILLLMTAAFGTDVYGAKRWLYIGPIGLQPSEFAKIALLITAVRVLVLYDSGMAETRALLLQVAMIIAPLAIIYKFQSDLGTTAICVFGILAIMYFGGINRKFLGFLVIGGILLILIAVFGTGYRSNRLVFLNPWEDGQGGLGNGYNIIRSFYAFAEGGLFGVGLGNSHEKYQYLFASDSDFIFAVIGEELGMVGAMLVILLFFVILVCGLSIAAQAPDLTGRLLAAGCTVMLVSQAFLNIGCAIGVFPTTGKPLPLISSGGSSMIATLIMIGLILSVSQQAGRESDEYERRRDKLQVVRTHDYIDMPYIEDEPEYGYGSVDIDAAPSLTSALGKGLTGRLGRSGRGSRTSSQDPGYAPPPDFSVESMDRRGEPALRLSSRKERRAGISLAAGQTRETASGRVTSRPVSGDSRPTDPSRSFRR